MSIYEKIKIKKQTSTINGALLGLIMGEICVDGKPMNDTDAIKKMSNMVKTCTKNVELYNSTGNHSMAGAEVLFRDLIELYLPRAATKEEIETVVTELCSQGLERNVKSMGRVMGHLKKSFIIVDGNLVRKVLSGGE